MNPRLVQTTPPVVVHDAAEARRLRQQATDRIRRLAAERQPPRT